MGYHLETRGLTVAHGASPILDDVSIGFERSRVTAVAGPSGAGKTTLLRCLNGLAALSQGTVLLDGTDIESIDAVTLRRRVGLVFQLPMILEGSVRENVLYGLRDRDVVVEDALARAGLDASYGQRVAGSLSVGEAQRVSIARALVREPDVLLMDEPTSALDRDSREIIESLVRSLSESGLTVVLVTHDLAQAERVADEAWLLVGGAAKANGHPSALHEMWDEHR